jgi:uncharacterized membrane protein
MAFFSFICDILGHFTYNTHLFEVAFWNILVAAMATFVAIVSGQFEAGLAQVYSVVQSTLNFHTLIGWSLGAIIAAITAWRFVIRDHLRRAERHHNPLKLPPG